MKTGRLLLSILFMLAFCPMCSASRISVLFSPHDKPTTKLLELINSAQKTIHAAVYMLTDKTIAQALINAKKNRNVDVKIILDRISTDKRFGKADFLAQNGVPVAIFDSRLLPSNRAFTPDNKWTFDNPIMHNKIAIFDGKTVWTGSFNWTVSANIMNCENVIITDNRELCKTYSGYFKELLQTRCKPYMVETTKPRRSPLSFREQIIHALESSKDDLHLFEEINMILTKSIN